MVFMHGNYFAQGGVVRGATTAKTARPSTSNVLPRERLFAALDTARRASLLWVHGPPGCGKTSLVSSYLDARASNGIWYQMDAGDTDPATLCLYLGETVGGNGDAGPRRLPLFTAEYQAEPRAFARHYFRSLFEALQPPFLLVFDNYHELGADSAVHDMVREALAEMRRQAYGLSPCGDDFLCSSCVFALRDHSGSAPRLG